MIRRLLASAAVLLVCTLPAAAAARAVSVSLDRTSVSTRLGHTFTFHSTIANRGGAATRN